MSTWIVSDSGPGSGPRVAVKDLIDMAGLPTTAGSRPVADAARPAVRDAACVAGLRAALNAGQARFAGKTNLHELAYGISGINSAFGTPVNPLDPRLMPGGSSSGSGTAVASGEADIAYGTDTGGSIRIPAACCGIAGLKTTRGRISNDGVRPLSPGLDSVGPMARDVAGVAAGMALLEPGFTVASDVPRTVGVLAIDADPRITAAIDTALRTAEFQLLPVAFPALDQVITAAITLLDWQAWQANKDLVAVAADQLGSDVRDRLKLASAITHGQLTTAEAVIARWCQTLDALWQRVDMLAAPTLLGFPPLLDEAHLLWKLRALTSPVNAAGVPSLALPLPVGGWQGGPVPANVQLIGPRGSEERLLAAGTVIEQAVRRLRGPGRLSAGGGPWRRWARLAAGPAPGGRCLRRICRQQRRRPWAAGLTHA